MWIPDTIILFICIYFFNSLLGAHVGRRGYLGPRPSQNRDTQALLDTGSVVTLLRPELAGGKKGELLEVACVHGYTRTYGTCHVVIRTPHGVFTTSGAPPAGAPPDREELPDLPQVVFPGTGRENASPEGEEGSAGVRGDAGSEDPSGVDG